MLVYALDVKDTLIDDTVIYYQVSLKWLCAMVNLDSWLWRPEYILNSLAITAVKTKCKNSFQVSIL